MLNANWRDFRTGSTGSPPTNRSIQAAFQEGDMPSDA
jgi:hypothetical protein